jgi:hypothetical protein
MYIDKTFKNLLLNIQRARAYLFTMKRLLIDFYQLCSNKSPGVKIGPVGGEVIDFP